MERHERAPVRAPTIVVHALLAVAAAGITLLGTLVAAEPSSRSAEVAGPVLAAVAAIAVLAAIRWPRIALAVTVVAVLGYHVADFPAIGMAWPLVVVVYLAASAGAAVAAGVTMAVLVIGAGVWRVVAEQHSLLSVTDGVVREAGLISIAILLGEVVHRRAAWRREIARRFADEQRQRDHERQHETAQQRLTIAREVHDTVAHTLAVVGVQADVAAETLRRGDTVRAAEALDVVRRTNRQALQELRTTVALLRNDALDADQRRPVPSLAALPSLVARVEASGLGVDLTEAADVGPLPSPADATAYRVVQEALTNVVRHARATSARIVLRRDDDALHVEVTDDGRAPVMLAEHEHHGNGLRGMRERAQAIGGKLQAGPLPDGGFRVRLTVPMREGP